MRAHVSNRAPLRLWPSPVTAVSLGDGLQHPVLPRGRCTGPAAPSQEVTSFSIRNMVVKEKPEFQFLVPVFPVSPPPDLSLPADRLTRHSSGLPWLTFILHPCPVPLRFPSRSQVACIDFLMIHPHFSHLRMQLALVTAHAYYSNKNSNSTWPLKGDTLLSLTYIFTFCLFQCSLFFLG